MPTKHQLIYARRPEHFRAKSIRYYRKNRTKVLAKLKQKHAANPFPLRKKASSWYWENIDQVKTYRRSEKYKDLCKKWRKKSAEQCRNSLLKCKYGITTDQYNEMLKTQGGVCAICKRPEHTRNRWGGTNVHLQIDHCHTHGVIRGLLCRKCNQFLGIMKDRVDWLENAISYLKLHQSLSSS